MKSLLNILINTARSREHHPQSRSPDNVGSAMLDILVQISHRGYLVRGIYQMDSMPCELPNIRKNPATGEYEIWMQNRPLAVCKRNFCIAVIAIIQGKEFLEGTYANCSTFDDFFTACENLREPYEQLLSVI